MGIATSDRKGVRLGRPGVGVAPDQVAYPVLSLDDQQMQGEWSSAVEAGPAGSTG